MTKIQDWATHTVHDGRMEHWRVTALLAKTSHGMWQALIELPKEEFEKLPSSITRLVPALYHQLELTDYFLSGTGESE